MRFYDKQFALDYEQRLAAESYPGGLLDLVAQELDGVRYVIDVGAGTGFFAIPLALRGYFIEAVEPSPHMLDIMKGKLDAETAVRVRIHQSTWEDWSGGRGDALICLHSIYPMPDIEAAIAKMIRYADRRILLVRSDEGSRNLSAILRQKTGKGRNPVAFFEGVERSLRSLGVEYAVRPVEQRRISTFADSRGEALYYCRYLGLPEDKVEDVRMLIEKQAVRHGDTYRFEGVYRDLMVVF